MNYRVVSATGRVVMPHSLRKQYGIKPGTKVWFYEEADGIKIMTLTHEMIDNNIGFMKIGVRLLKL